MISIHELKEQSYKKYYGASRKVFRNSDVVTLLRMWSDLHYLSELYTRTQITPCNEEFLNKKAIPSYNRQLIYFQRKYPLIKEFQKYKLIKV